LIKNILKDRYSKDTCKKGLYVVEISQNFGKRPVLRDVSLQVQSGEAVGLLGPNGAGKTTCFSIITGALFPDSGSVFLDQLNISRFPIFERARMGIGYLPQDISIFRGFNVEDNINCVLELILKDPDKRVEKLEYLLDEFSLNHIRKSQALSLSGGERRRVEIARALALSPRYMLLDEPLAGIDPIAVCEIRELITRLKKMGIGILITDHNVRETLDIVDRAYILSQGKILTEGTPKEIVANEDVRRVYLGNRFSF
jgi:lipopolysaccharide export system ATP-binding protein